VYKQCYMHIIYNCCTFSDSTLCCHLLWTTSERPKNSFSNTVKDENTGMKDDSERIFSQHSKQIGCPCDLQSPSGSDWPHQYSLHWQYLTIILTPRCVISKPNPPNSLLWTRLCLLADYVHSKAVIHICINQSINQVQIKAP